jgi:hypothetical protein
MAERTTWLSVAGLVVALAGFVWWNLQPGSASVVSAGPDHLLVEYRGPGWPMPEYTGRARWNRPDAPAEWLKDPRPLAAGWMEAREGSGQPVSFELSTRVRWVLNGPVGALLVAALVASLARSHRDAWRSGDRDWYHRCVGYSLLVVLGVVMALALLAILGTGIVGLERWPDGLAEPGAAPDRCT